MNPKYHVNQDRGLWRVLCFNGSPFRHQGASRVYDGSHLPENIGHATTLSGAVTLAEDHAGRKLEFSWSDDFQSGEGQ